MADETWAEIPTITLPAQEMDLFGVLHVQGAEPWIAMFHPTDRDDGWESVTFTKPQPCGYCGIPVEMGWLEMECDAVRCMICVPERRE